MRRAISHPGVWVGLSATVLLCISVQNACYEGEGGQNGVDSGGAYGKGGKGGTAGKAGTAGSATAGGVGGTSGVGGTTGKGGTTTSGAGGAQAPYWAAWSNDETAWKLAPGGDVAAPDCTLYEAIKSAIPPVKVAWAPSGTGGDWTKLTDLEDDDVAPGFRMPFNMALRTHRAVDDATPRVLMAFLRSATGGQTPDAQTGTIADADTGVPLHAIRMLRGDNCTWGIPSSSALSFLPGVYLPAVQKFHHFFPRLGLADGTMEWGKGAMSWPGGATYTFDASNRVGINNSSSLFVTLDPTNNTSLAPIYQSPEQSNGEYAERDLLVWVRTSYAGTPKAYVMSYPVGGSSTEIAELPDGYEGAVSGLSRDRVTGLVVRKSPWGVKLWWGARPNPPSKLSLTTADLPIPAGSNLWGAYPAGDYIVFQYELGSQPVAGEVIPLLKTGLFHISSGKVFSIPVPKGWYFGQGVFTGTDTRLYFGIARFGGLPTNTDKLPNVRRLLRFDLGNVDKFAVPGLN